MDQQRYVIAVRRDARDRVPEGWVEALGAIEGVAIVGADNPARVQVDATPAAIAQARALCGDFAHVEPAIEHRPL